MKTRARVVIALVAVWVGGVSSASLAYEFLLKPPPPPFCQSPGAVYEAAPYRVPEAPRAAPARPEGA